jgi:hypothetical protein
VVVLIKYIGYNNVKAVHPIYLSASGKIVDFKKVVSGFNKEG